jgi:hypothetical protein
MFSINRIDPGHENYSGREVVKIVTEAKSKQNLKPIGIRKVFRHPFPNPRLKTYFLS